MGKCLIAPLHLKSLYATFTFYLYIYVHSFLAGENTSTTTVYTRTLWPSG